MVNVPPMLVRYADNPNAFAVHGPTLKDVTSTFAGHASDLIMRSAIEQEFAQDALRRAELLAAWDAHARRVRKENGWVEPIEIVVE